MVREPPRRSGIPKNLFIILAFNNHYLFIFLASCGRISTSGEVPLAHTVSYVGKLWYSLLNELNKTDKSEF